METKKNKQKDFAMLCVYYGIWLIALVLFFLIVTLSSCKKYELDDSRSNESAKKRLIGHYNSGWEFKSNHELWVNGIYSTTNWKLTLISKNLVLEYANGDKIKYDILKLSNDSLILTNQGAINPFLMIKN